MVLSLCIFVLTFINTSVNVDLEPLPKDITEILEKLVAHIEDARNSKIQSSTLAKNEQATDGIPSNFIENEQETPNNLKDLIFLDNKESETTLDPGIDPVDQKLLQDEIVGDTSGSSRRNSPPEVDNENYLKNKIEQTNRVNDANNSVQQFNNHTRTVTKDSVHNITKLNEYLERLLQKKKDSIRLRKNKQVQLESLKSKYKNVPERYDNVASIPLTNNHLILPKYHIFRDPYIVRRTPTFYPQLNPQRTFIKSSPKRIDIIRNNQTYEEQLLSSTSIVPKVKGVLVRQFPLLVHNIPKFIWSF